jgi:electron transfer flavoprotein beta subunit
MRRRPRNPQGGHVNIGVLLKQVPDTETKVRINSDASGIEEDDIKWIVNPYDEFAVEEALKLNKTLGEGEVVIFSLGRPKTLDAARTALAMGAHRAVILDDDGFQGSDAYGAASALAKAIEIEDIGLVFAGKIAIDDQNVQAPQIVAAKLGWPHVTGVNQFEHEGGTVLVRRAVGGGVAEVVRVTLPAVVTCDKGLNTPRYASLPGIMKAKRKPVKRYSPADLGVEDDVGADNAKVVLSNYHMPPGRPAGRILEGELSDQIAELVKALREEAKVI